MQTYFQQQAIGSGKRVRTRSCLIDSAVEVFADKGIGNARISDIAERAGLANGTFYNHFKDKEQLAAEAALAIALEIAKQLDDAMIDVDDAVARIVIATTNFLHAAVVNENWGAVLVDCFHLLATLRNDAVRYLRQDIQRGIDQGDFTVTLDDFLLDQLGALIVAALRRQLESGFDPQLVARTTEHLLRVLGLTPAKAARAVARARPELEGFST